MGDLSVWMHSVSLEMEKSVTQQGDLSRGQRDPGNAGKSR